MLPTSFFPSIDVCEIVEVLGEGVGHNIASCFRAGWVGSVLSFFNPWFVAALSLMKCLGEGVVYIVDQDSAGSVTM